MDPDMLLHRSRRALILQANAGNDEERRAYRQFARDYSVQIDGIEPRLRRQKRTLHGALNAEVCRKLSDW
jgi:hypothetical protein